MKTSTLLLLAIGLTSSFIGQAQTNILDTSTWTVGTGYVNGFSTYGPTTENERINGIDPHGNTNVLWVSKPSGDGGPDGGIFTDSHTIDPTQTYRYTIWLKKTGSTSGNSYFGLYTRNASNQETTMRFDGSINTNPYFWWGDLPELDKWYLLEGYIHPNSYSGPSLGKIYDGTTGNVVSSLTFTDYRFGPGAATLMLRSVLFADTNSSDRQYYWGPTIYLVNGQEPSISSLLNPSGNSDTAAPTAPVLSSTGQSTTTVNLSWSGATDNIGVTGYTVFQDNVQIQSNITGTSYQVSGLSPSTAYTFTVRAYDAAGNQSGTSNPVAVTTNSTTDTQAPTAPTLATTGQSATTVDLSWSGATDNIGVTGYTVFRDNVQLQTNITATSYQVTGLSPSTAYNFKVRANDAAGNQSPDSNDLSITTDADPGNGGGSSGTSVWTESNAVASYSGKVQVGNITVPAAYAMAIDGKLITEEVRVELSGTWPDYVFSEDYDLLTLEEIQKHIEEKGHLPNIPSAQEVEAKGIALGEMNRLLLEKIEELTLYILIQQKQIKQLQRGK
ncbi:MAG: fibronectin type III domain-containing protein [Bacteroidota bacterium]